MAKDSSVHVDDEKPLTAEEKQWFKESGYGNEFKFLAAHQLSIYKEGDRQEGRALTRGYMKMDKYQDDAATKAGGSAPATGNGK
ncbi:hypothetical protein HRG_000549 [Hirsutella rhossiliensis]|uniref:Uncharacterized protein n=1 Tax=Hirsutella rhossiliensis TaxID=111463 RepID=A0A9P8N6K1_9HYPO|nr:uncharacterized protein HRG_00549 [Hirsutella rhossiliensis]KAH0967907.1 hypothetical protein HRG_00549 [Hirsutella rhossiliensis]